MKCKLCGFEFTESAKVCSSCPVVGKCGKVICCPHCGYQTIEESKLTEILNKWISKMKKGVNKYVKKN